MESEIVHSKLNMASYGCGKALNEFFSMAFGATAFYFYEAALGLDSLFAGIGFMIYAVWNSINDPIIGYFTNRPFKFTRKWGRRFPWMLIGGIPWIFCYYLIFVPPSTAQLAMFFWLIFTTCLFDGFGSFWFVNFMSLFPDKFRGVRERRTASGIATPIGILGIASGAILPSLFYQYEHPATFVIAAGVVVIGAIILFGLSIPGSRDEKVYVDRYLKSYEENPNRQPFFTMLVKTLKHKNFLVFIITYLLYQFLVASMIASIPYVNNFLLGQEASATTMIMAGFLIGALISIFFWIRAAQKTNKNKNVLVVAGYYLAAMTLVLFFVRDYWIMVMLLIIWGGGLGGFWAIYPPTFAETIDEAVLMFQSREEGIYNGIFQFFGRFSTALQAISFSVVHMLTGFAEGSETQTAEAVFGIQIHFALIPAIAMFIGVTVFLLFYDLNPEKIEGIKIRIKELGL